MHTVQADANGITPLFLAAQNGFASIVGALLYAGARATAAMDDGATPLLIAAEHGM